MQQKDFTMSNLNRIREKLEALKRLKDKAGSEAEALNAAEKIKDIIDKYGLDLSEADLEESPFTDIELDLGTKNAARYVHSVMAGVARFCNVLRYTDIRHGKKVGIYFGRKHEVELAVYLHEVIFRAIGLEVRAYRKTNAYRELRTTGLKRTATNSFRVGMAMRIGKRLKEMAVTHEQSDPGVNALMISRNTELYTALHETGIRLTKTPIKGTLLEGAFEHGRTVGNSTPLVTGINTNDRGQRLLG
jgi:hypothetical protein